jgi:hypothetical protein
MGFGANVAAAFGNLGAAWAFITPPMASDRQNKAQEYRRRAQEARARAAAAATAAVRKTQLEDADMFDRMAQREEKKTTPNDNPREEFLDWEPDRWAAHYRVGGKPHGDKV